MASGAALLQLVEASNRSASRQLTARRFGRSAPGTTEFHPTHMPLEVFLRPVESHTEIEDMLYEPFSRSGTQIIPPPDLIGSMIDMGDLDSEEA